MAYEPKELEWSLFKNEKKTEPNQPDYTGRILLNGVSMRMAGWLKQRDGASTFFTGNVSEFKQKDTAPVADPINPGMGVLDDDSPPPMVHTAPAPAPMNDDLPF
jgi:hypothetical protein